MTDLEEWSTDANQAVKISLVQPGDGEPKTLSTFHPEFTYPVFGEEERIFGYQGLSIHLRFAAHDLLPNVEITYDKKFEAVGETEATDVKGALQEWVPSTAFDSWSNFTAHVQDYASVSAFTPPGKMIEQYSHNDRNFEIWRGVLTDSKVKELISRIQIMISFFIEGGIPLELSDEEWTQARWQVFFVYEKLSTPSVPNSSPYSLVGYSTTYHFLSYQPSSSPSKSSSHTFTLPPDDPFSPTSLPTRARISQFLILPHHQSHSHGTHLFNTLTSTFLSSPTISEITVEDPSEAFDDLRDYCDYTRLLNNGTFSQISLNTSLPSKVTTKRIGVRVPTSQLLDIPLITSLRQKNKLAPRQFARLVELYLFSRIPRSVRVSGTARLTQKARTTNEDDKMWYYWRLLVKQRVYKKNRDVLMQLDRLERVEKVEETVGEVVGDYERLLRGLEGKGGAKRLGRAKRRIVDDEDEDPEREAEAADAGKHDPKRNRLYSGS